jgi:hypothetical protein
MSADGRGERLPTQIEGDAYQEVKLILDEKNMESFNDENPPAQNTGCLEES